MRLTSLFLAIATSIAATSLGYAQQGDFSPVMQVNDSVITGFEMQQRIKFLQLLRFPGDIQAEAEKGLTEDRLRLQAAKAQGVSVSPDDLQAGMTEFAGRANLTLDQFLAAIAHGGVEVQSYRDFVRAGLAWRAMVGAKFGGRVTISESEIDRALSSDYGRGAGPKVLISEIILPAKQGGIGPVRALAADLTANIHSESDFAAAARRYSVAASRANGGKIDWIPISNLPGPVRAALAKLGTGQLTGPVPLPNGVGLFQMRGLKDGATTVEPADVTVDFAQFFLAPGSDSAAELARVRAGADQCDDLYRLAKGLPADQLRREKMRRGKISGAVLAALDQLDPNEMTLVKSGGGASILMLCSRNATLAATGALDAAVTPEVGTAPDGEIIPSAAPGVGYGLGPSRDQVREELVGARMGQLADAYLARLKADAIILHR